MGEDDQDAVRKCEAQRQQLFEAFHEVTVGFSDITGQFGVTKACPACLDVSALINKAIDLNLEKAGAGSVSAAEEEQALFMHRLQWLMVVHYVENIIEQFHASNVPFDMVIFENKARVVDPSRAAIHAAVLEHLQKNTAMGVHIMPSPQSEAWAAYVDIKVPSMLFTEYPSSIESEYNTQCYATLWCLCHDAVPVVLFDHLENHNPRFKGYHLDPRALDTVQEELAATVHDLLRHGASQGPMLQDVAELHRLVPDTLNAAKVIALAGVLAEAGLSSAEERAIGALFLLQGLFTDALRLEDMSFRGVTLPPTASAVRGKCADVVFALHKLLRLFPTHKDGHAPTIYDGKVLHTMLAYAHLSTGSGSSTISSIATAFTIADEFAACAGLFKQLKLGWLVGDLAIPVSRCEGSTGTAPDPAQEALEAWTSTKEDVQREIKEHADAAIVLHPVRQNELMSQLLLDEGEEEDPHSSDALALAKLKPSDSPWDDSKFKTDHQLYVRFSNEEEDELTEEERRDANRHQQNMAFIKEVNKYIKLGRNRRLMHERDARPLLRDVIHRAPGNWRRRLEQCYNISHWAGAVPICLKARRAFDEARARQRLAAFQTAFAQTLLGQLKKMNLDPKRNGKDQKIRDATVLHVFESNIEPAKQALVAVKDKLAELRDLAKTARSTRSEKRINEWFQKQARLFQHNGKPVEDKLPNEDKAREIVSKRKTHAKHREKVKKFDEIGYQEKLNDLRAEAAVIELDIHMLRLGWHLEDEQESNAGKTDSGGPVVKHRDTDPCVLSKADHLLVPVVNCILDALEHLCDAKEKLHESMLPLHKRVLGPMLQLGFTADVNNTLTLLRDKYEVTTTLDDLKSLRRFDIAENTLLDFQMRAMGPYLKRPEGHDDERSPFFKPDDWQVELLDAVDERRSALISAPTSSGKTFVSFYAMEKVLRAETDLDDPKQRGGAQDQIVVYVSPTKALVNQTVAEIEGRYEKKTSKRLLATAFTKEFGMEDYSECRVLVTVPECFEHVLLLAGNDGWKKRIKWVIFDEVHSISLNQGFFWERLLTLIDCPFLALSATIGDTEGFTAWLERLERERLARRGGDVERPLVKIRHHLRWNDLDSWCYDLEQGRMVTVNPLGVLSPAKLAKDGFPSGCRLLPEYTHELWSIVSAILEQREGLGKASRDLLTSLDPSKWFVEKQPVLGDPSYNLSGRIRVRTYAEYEEHVKATLATLAGMDQGLLRELSTETGTRIDGPSSKMLADRDLQDGKKLLAFLRHMRNGPANRLPALLFHLNVGGINRIQELLARALQREQDEHYYLVEVLGSDRRKLDNVHAQHLHDAREKVDTYKHTLYVEVQHIADDEKREQELQKLVDAEVDHQLDLLWEDAYYRMNQHWKDQKTKEVRSKAQAELNDMVANGDIPRDPPALQEQENNMVHAEMDRLSSERIQPFCLSDLPVSLDDMVNAFPKANKHSLLRKIDENLFFQALRRGIGIHYTELTKDKRQAVERLFRERRLAVVISTETLALGISMPCRSVVFLGDNPALDSLNFHQMSGRAGRRGHDIRGHVIFYGISKHKIRRLLSSPLRQMFPNMPLDATTAIRAMARLQQAHKDTKEKEALGLRRLLLEPYAAQDPKRQEMLLVYMRAQLETLLNLNILTFDTNPELTKYLEDKEKERKRRAEEGEAAALADEEAGADEEENKGEKKEPPETWEDLVDDWESLAEGGDADGGEVSDAEADQGDEGQQEQEQGQEQKQEEPADPNRPLKFAGPVVGSMGSLVSYLACHDPNNMWMAYMVREGVLATLIPPQPKGQKDQKIEDVLLRNERLALFQAILASMPHDRVHPTEVVHTKQRFPEAPDVHLVEPPLPKQLLAAAVRYRERVLFTFTNILRLHGLAKAPAGANEGLPLSKAQVGGNKALPQDLANFKIYDPLRLPTAAVSGDGFKYATVRELLLEIQRLPGLSVDVVPIPPCVDERDPHLRGVIYDVYRRSDLENLLAQAKLLENAFYTEVANFHHYAKIMVEALQRRLPKRDNSDSDAQKAEQPQVEEEKERPEEGKKEGVKDEDSEGKDSEDERMVKSLKFVVSDFYASLERIGLIWT